MTATSAAWGVWTNGESIEYLCKPPGQSAVHADLLNNIPVRGQRIEDVGKIAKSDLKPYSGTALKVSFHRILNTLYANTNISRREKLGNEMIKLLFAKIRDETTFPENPPAFYAGYKEPPDRVKARINDLFRGVVDEYVEDGLFEPHDSITLDAKGVAWVVGQLERGSLVDTPSDVVGDAFEVFAESKFVGEKGEFFTPRGVIDIAVKLVEPHRRTRSVTRPAVAAVSSSPRCARCGKPWREAGSGASCHLTGSRRRSRAWRAGASSASTRKAIWSGSPRRTWPSQAMGEAT